MVDIDSEFYELKSAVAHLDLGLKAYRAAVRDQIDASRLLESIDSEMARLIDSAQAAREKVQSGLKTPVGAEGQ